MKTAPAETFPREDYAPHILSGAVSRRQSGRRTPGLNKPSGCFPWYTTYTIDQGPFTIKEESGEKKIHEGPAVVTLPPNPRTQILIPSSTLYSWLEWGAIRLPLCHRDNLNASRKYPEGYEQPPPQEVWQQDIPVPHPKSIYRPSAGMMVRINSLWWRGKNERLLADAELALWIAKYLLSPTKKGSKGEEEAELFPEATPAFRTALSELAKSVSTGIDISDWALALEMSPRSLQRWCRQETGLSPLEVLNRIRLREAEKLLREGNHILTQVAKRSGFSSTPSFSAWFSKQKGLSPRRWSQGLR